MGYSIWGEGALGPAEQKGESAGIGETGTEGPASCPATAPRFKVP